MPDVSVEKSVESIPATTLGQQYTVTFGGWYQRTTLHLSEVYGFLSAGYSKLNLSKPKLQKLKEQLNITNVSRESGYFEYVHATTDQGIRLRYYEDGLYVLQIETDNIDEATKQLRAYFEDCFEPALNYIFSLGAPTPKILANIKSEHQVVVHCAVKDVTDSSITTSYGQVYSHLAVEDMAVYKTPSHIFILTKNNAVKHLQELVEMQIFFREFKDQLEKYLNIHRDIWEAIDKIAERKNIRGKNIEETRAMLDSYKKTISLISNRINQMDNYINTRASISEKLDLEDKMMTLFQYRFEVLTDTLEYVKELWGMTSDYLEQAIDILSDIQERAADSSIKSLRAITTLGVVTGFLTYLQVAELPKDWVTPAGAMYFVIIFSLALLMNWVVGFVYKMNKYKVKFVDPYSKL